jgi:hypothetical protein
METNRTDAARSLLADLKQWCMDTETPETSVGHVLFFHPGFVGLLRKRLQVTPEKEAAAREFMADNPDGWRGPLPEAAVFGSFGPAANPRRGRSIKRQKTAIREAERAEIPRVDRDPCPRCGTRRDIGCNHSRTRLGMML